MIKKTIMVLMSTMMMMTMRMMITRVIVITIRITLMNNCWLAGWLVVLRPNNMLVCLRDESPRTVAHTAKLRQKLQIKLAVSSSHGTLTQGRPVQT